MMDYEQIAQQASALWNNITGSTEIPQEAYDIIVSTLQNNPQAVIPTVQQLAIKYAPTQQQNTDIANLGQLPEKTKRQIVEWAKDIAPEEGRKIGALEYYARNPRALVDLLPGLRLFLGTQGTETNKQITNAIKRLQENNYKHKKDKIKDIRLVSEYVYKQNLPLSTFGKIGTGIANLPGYMAEYGATYVAPFLLPALLGSYAAQRYTQQPVDIGISNIYNQPAQNIPTTPTKRLASALGGAGFEYASEKFGGELVGKALRRIIPKAIKPLTRRFILSPKTRAFFKKGAYAGLPGEVAEEFMQNVADAALGNIPMQQAPTQAAVEAGKQFFSPENLLTTTAILSAPGAVGKVADILQQPARKQQYRYLKELKKRLEEQRTKGQEIISALEETPKEQPQEIMLEQPKEEVKKKEQEPNLIYTKSNKPFKGKRIAEIVMRRKGIEGEVVKVEDGYAIKPKAEAEREQQLEKKTEQIQPEEEQKKEIKLYHGTKQKTTQLTPDADGLIFVTTSKDFAKEYAYNKKHPQEEEIEKDVKERKKTFFKQNNINEADFWEDFYGERKKYPSQYYNYIEQLEKLPKTKDLTIYEVNYKPKKIFNIDEVSPSDPIIKELLNTKRMQSSEITNYEQLKNAIYLPFENKEIVNILKKYGYDAIALKETTSSPRNTIAIITNRPIKVQNPITAEEEPIAPSAQKQEEAVPAPEEAQPQTQETKKQPWEMTKEELKDYPDLAERYGEKQKKAEAMPSEIKETLKPQPSFRKQLAEKRRQKKLESIAEPEEAPAEIEKGNKEDVFTPRGNKIETQFAIVNADDLIVSHSEFGHKNPKYPEILQPRERTRISSKAQIYNIANKLTPELLTSSAKADSGSPIVGKDLIVESGNGRVLAIKIAYNKVPEKAKQYKQYLINNAEKFGLSPEKIKQLDKPILVRIRTTKFTPEERLNFTREANEQEKLELSDTEQAKIDAEKLTSEDLAHLTLDENTPLTAAANRQFITRFLQHFTPAERAAFTDKEGKLSARGLTRIRNALFYKAYGDTKLLERLAEDIDNNMRNITQALLNAAPYVAQIRDMQEKGLRHKKDVNTPLLEGIKLIEEMRNSGKPLSLIASQGLLWGGEYSPIAIEIAKFIDKNKRSARRITEFITKLYSKINELGSPKQEAFGFVEPSQLSEEELIEKTLKEFGQGEEKQDQFLFMQPKKKQPPSTGYYSAFVPFTPEQIKELKEIGASKPLIRELVRKAKKAVFSAKKFITSIAPQLADDLNKAQEMHKLLNMYFQTPIEILRGRVKPEDIKDTLDVKELEPINPNLIPYAGSIIGDQRAEKLSDEEIAKKAKVSIEEVQKARKILEAVIDKVFTGVYNLYLASGAPTAGFKEKYLPVNIKPEIMSQLLEGKGKYADALRKYFEQQASDSETVIDPLTGHTLPKMKKAFKTLKSIADKKYGGDMIKAYIATGGLRPTVYLDVMEGKLRFHRTYVLPHWAYAWDRWISTAIKYLDTANRVISLYNVFVHGKKAPSSYELARAKDIFEIPILKSFIMKRKAKKAQKEAVNTDDTGISAEEFLLDNVIREKIDKLPVSAAEREDVLNTFATILSGGKTERSLMQARRAVYDFLTLAGLTSPTTAVKNVLLGLVSGSTTAKLRDLASAITPLVAESGRKYYSKALTSGAILSGERILERRSDLGGISKVASLGFRLGERVLRTTMNTAGSKQIEDTLKMIEEVNPNYSKFPTIKSSAEFEKKMFQWVNNLTTDRKQKNKIQNIKANLWLFHKVGITPELIRDTINGYRTNKEIPERVKLLFGKTISDFTQGDVSVENLPTWISNTPFARLLTFLHKTSYILVAPPLRSAEMLVKFGKIAPISRYLLSSLLAGLIIDYLRGNPVMLNKQYNILEKSFRLLLMSEIFGVFADLYRFINGENDYYFFLFQIMSSLKKSAIALANAALRGTLPIALPTEGHRLLRNVGIVRFAEDFINKKAHPLISDYKEARRNAFTWREKNITKPTAFERSAKRAESYLSPAQPYYALLKDYALRYTIYKMEGNNKKAKEYLRRFIAVKKSLRKYYLEQLKVNRNQIADKMRGAYTSVIARRPLPISEKYHRKFLATMKKDYPDKIAKWQKMDKIYKRIAKVLLRR